MNLFYLKVLACLFMLIDHIGAILLPNYISLRIIGRLAFPIFAFGIANGYYNTKDKKKYLFRLFSFGCLIQIPYSIIADTARLNIFLTLSFGLLFIIVYDSNLNILLKTLSSFLILYISDISNMDYGSYGVLLIFLFYVFYEDKLKLFTSFFGLNILFIYFVGFSNIQIFSLFSLIFINLYNFKLGIKARYLFYIFYPAHLMVLHLINIYN